MTGVSERLDAIEARKNAATKGPWRWRNTGEPMLLGGNSRLVMAFSRMGMGSAQPEFRDSDGLMVKAGKENLNSFPDAEFIAHAPQDITDLLDLARKQQAAIDGVRAVEPIKHGTDHDARFANGYNAAIAGIRAALTGEGGA